MVSLDVLHRERLGHGLDAAAAEPQAVGGVVQQPVAARLRLEQQGEGRIARDADARDRVHLHGDGEGHGRSCRRRGRVSRSSAYTRPERAGEVFRAPRTPRRRASVKPTAQGLRASQARAARAIRRRLAGLIEFRGGAEVGARLDLDEGDGVALSGDRGRSRRRGRHSGARGSNSLCMSARSPRSFRR